MSDRDQKIKEFKALDDISRVLTIPSRYIGSVNPDALETYLFIKLCCLYSRHAQDN